MLSHRLRGGLLVFQTDIGKSYILQAENKTSAPCYMKDVEPVFLFDQVSVQLPFYEGLPTLAPGENTVAMLSEDVEGITFICSSNFPNFDINRNTGDPNGRECRIAENTVYHEAEHASCIVLPIYP